MKGDHFGNTDKKAGFPKQKIKVREPAPEAENPEEMKGDHFGNTDKKGGVPEVDNKSSGTRVGSKKSRRNEGRPLREYR